MAMSGITTEVRLNHVPDKLGKAAKTSVWFKNLTQCSVSGINLSQRDTAASMATSFARIRWSCISTVDSSQSRGISL